MNHSPIKRFPWDTILFQANATYGLSKGTPLVIISGSCLSAMKIEDSLQEDRPILLAMLQPLPVCIIKLV